MRRARGEPIDGPFRLPSTTTTTNDDGPFIERNGHVQTLRSFDSCFTGLLTHTATIFVDFLVTILSLARFFDRPLSTMPPKSAEKDVEMQPLTESSERSSILNTHDEKDNTQGKNKWGWKSSGGLKALSACGLYSFYSVSMILVNKSLASR
jgi:hypothetical protein